MRLITAGLLLAASLLSLIVWATFKRGAATAPLASSATTTLPVVILNPTPTPILTEVTGDMREQIDYLEDNAPRAGSEGYRIPTLAEMDEFAGLAQHVLAKELLLGREVAAAHHYELIHYQDEGDRGEKSYLLRENPSGQMGWGLYGLRQDSATPLVVEAPHTLADENTPALALAIYRILDARALLVAGAHREANQDGSADVAHVPHSIFQTMHTIWSEKAVVLQIHGFAAENHPDYPQVILGSDQAPSTPLIDDLAQALIGQGVKVGVCDGQQWRELCGTQNVQSGSVDTAVFIHIELDEGVRNNPETFLNALTQVTYHQSSLKYADNLYFESIELRIAE